MNHQTKYRLNEITKIENYFIEEINHRKLCSKKLSKHVADYIDKILIVLSATRVEFVLFLLEVLLEHLLDQQVQVLL